jgi:hypothetical protein
VPVVVFFKTASSAVSTNLVDLLIFATMYAVNSASTSDEPKSSKAQLGLAAFKAAFAACVA